MLLLLMVMMMLVSLPAAAKEMDWCGTGPDMMTNGEDTA